MGVPFAENHGEYFGGKSVNAGTGSGSGPTHRLHPPPRHPLSLSRLKTESPVPALRSARLRGWRRRQDDSRGDITGNLPEREGDRDWSDAGGSIDSVLTAYSQQGVSIRQGQKKGRHSSGGGVKEEHRVVDESGNGGNGGNAWQSSWRGRISKTEPWVLDLPYRPSEKDSRARWSEHGYSPAEGGRQQRVGEGMVEFNDEWTHLQQDQPGKGGSSGNRGRRIIRPSMEEAIPSTGKKTSSMCFRFDIFCIPRPLLGPTVGNLPCNSNSPTLEVN